MSHNHDHNHDHEVITLVDEQGNETLFEILLTIDGREEFGKNYVLLVNGGEARQLTTHAAFDSKSKHTHSLKMKTVLKATFNQSLKIQMLNGI